MRKTKPQKKGSLTGMVLRLFGKSKGSEKFTSGQEEIVHAGIPGTSKAYKFELKNVDEDVEQPIWRAITMYKCSICGQTYRSKSGLQFHKEFRHHRIGS